MMDSELPCISWQYDMRRKKQEIIPNVYLGPYQAAAKSELENLRNDGITHILCVRQDVEARCVKVNFPDIFIYKVIEFRDHPCESIISILPEARNFINECLQSKGKILIHGVNGMSRSASLVIAYIMETRSISYEEAFEIVKRRRFCIAPNYGFRSQLQEYEPIYKARNMSSQWMENTSNTGKKRRVSSEESSFEME
ncbi:serine/threonine/tyrosine-interacting protein A-like [Styela clava]